MSKFEGKQRQMGRGWVWGESIIVLLSLDMVRLVEDRGPFRPFSYFSWRCLNYIKSHIFSFVFDVIHSPLSNFKP